MMFFDWNKNGKQDSFDRYMDYMALHYTNPDSGNDEYDELDEYDEYLDDLEEE